MSGDIGARCDRHAGEAFLVRCYDCMALNAAPEADSDGSGMCRLHTDYPSSARFPCERCKRERDQS